MEHDNIAWIILNCAKDNQWGKHKLAAFLKGSREKEIFIHCNLPFYGGLFWLSIGAIEGFIGQLEQMELLKRIKLPGSIYSFYIATEAGEKVIQEKMPIPLQAVAKEKKLSVGETEKKTLELFNQGKGINDITIERSLTVSTIYSHFEKLIANKLIHASQIIPEEKRKLIAEKYNVISSKKLKEIKEGMPESISYDEIKCIIAQLKTEQAFSQGGAKDGQL